MITKFNFDIFIKNIDLIFVRLSAEAEYLGLMAESSVWQLPLGQIRPLPKTRRPSYHLKITQKTQPKSLQNYFFPYILMEKTSKSEILTNNYIQVKI